MKIAKAFKRITEKMSPERKLALVKSSFIKERITNIYGTIDNFISMTEVLESVYPGQWDIELEYKLKENQTIYFRVWLLIHYPQIVITNSNGTTHTITDLYVRLQVDYDNLEGSTTIRNFSARRFSADIREIMSQYQHSHQPSRTYTENSEAFQYRGFCKGSSQIQTVENKLVDRYNPETFKLFLFQLEEFLNWESLEGTPYAYIESITGRTEGIKISKDELKDYYNDLKHYYEESGDIIDLDFKITKGDIFIRDNDKLEDFLKFKGNDFNKYNARYIAVKDEGGKYFGFVNIPDTLPEELLSSNLSKLDFYFRGELKQFQVFKPTETKEQKEFFIHPKIKEYVKQRFEKRIKKEKFRGHILKKLHSLNNS